MQESLDQVKSNLDSEIRNSKRQDLNLLEKNMLASPFHPDLKPLDSATHHIGSVGDQRAERTRKVLYDYNIPTSHAVNGTFMPRSNKHVPHKIMPNAYAHSTIHTDIYYQNVDIYVVETAEMKNVNRDKILAVLRNIGIMLQAGTFSIDEEL